MHMDVEEDIHEACRVMQARGVILYPTDTVWGIGCDATCSDAVKRVFEIKRRIDSKALIVLVGDMAQLSKYVANVPEEARSIIASATRPTTIVYDHGQDLAPELLADDGSVGIRVTAESFSRRLCNTFNKPIVSTSANISGQPAPAVFRNITPEILDSVDYIVRCRREENAPHRPSSVIKISDNGTINILRQ